jgi:hypothetical protein
VWIVLSQEQERMKSLIAFKKRMEEQREKLYAETKEVEAALETINGILVEKGFKRGDLKEVPEPPVPKEVVLPIQETEKSKPPTQHLPEPESVIPLKTMADEPLALIYFEEHSMHVLPDETKNFSVNTPPFSNFLVEKVLAKMEEKDTELVKANQLKTEKMFAYNIIREGDHIREIVIRNVDEERLKELKSSIRWTFEKMYEKMKST